MTLYNTITNILLQISLGHRLLDGPNSQAGPPYPSPDLGKLPSKSPEQQGRRMNIHSATELDGASSLFSLPFLTLRHSMPKLQATDRQVRMRATTKHMRSDEL